MNHAMRLVVVVGLLATAGCAPKPPSPPLEVVVGGHWREVTYRALSMEGCTTISINQDGFVSFEIRERVKSVADTTMLTAEQMASFRDALPSGATLKGDERLIVDALEYTISIDDQPVTVNRSSAGPEMLRAIGWFDAYAATLRQSATTRPWFK